MKLTIACIGLLLCVGCVDDGLLPTPLALHTDEALQDLGIERYAEYVSAAYSGNMPAARQALNGLIDVYEEMLRRPSITGPMTPQEVQAMRDYLAVLRETLNTALNATPS